MKAGLIALVLAACTQDVSPDTPLDNGAPDTQEEQVIYPLEDDPKANYSHLASRLGFTSVELDLFDWTLRNKWGSKKERKNYYIEQNIIRMNIGYEIESHLGVAETRSFCYATLSGNGSEYNRGTITDSEIEARLGLSEDDILHLTGFDHDSCSAVLTYASVPCITRDQIHFLLQVELNEKFVTYAVEQGKDFKGLLQLKQWFSQQGLNKFDVANFVVYADDEQETQVPQARITDNESRWNASIYLPTPEEIVLMDKKGVKPTSFKYLADKGYTVDDAVRLTEARVHASYHHNERREFNYFEQLGVTDVNGIIELVEQYGTDIAKELVSHELTVCEIDVYQRMQDREAFAKLGIKGDDLAKLVNADVSGTLAEEYRARGFSTVPEMILLKNQGIDKEVLQEMERYGFIKPKTTIVSTTTGERIEGPGLGYLLTAFDSYQTHLPELKESGI